ncbi:MAG: type II toxin-antitoxin system Phd/YefM family antitoxin [Candidatus Promineofilum sp.]|jgi:prevent-host-death family protein|nr:type II toxin-antitoxin system Phd/YefM family antitoxin [Promineifilum sp.]
MTTKIMPISDLRRNAGEVLNAVREDGEVVYITQHGRPAAVLVEYKHYEAMLAQLEDMADLAAIAAAADEPARDYADFLAELGRGES